MKIFIGADSRGFNVESKYFIRKKSGDKKTIKHKKYSSDFSWIFLLLEMIKNKHDVELSSVHGKDMKRKRRLVSFASIGQELRGKSYDLAIIQCGIHECLSWSKPVWFSFYPGIKNEELIKSGQNDGYYVIKDMSMIKDKFAEIISSVDRCLFIGVHSWRVPKRNWKHKMYHNRILQMHKFISEVDKVDVLNMPMSKKWVTDNCSDGIHYNKLQHVFILNYIIRYLERHNKSIYDLLKFKE